MSNTNIVLKQCVDFQVANIVLLDDRDTFGSLEGSQVIVNALMDEYDEFLTDTRSIRYDLSELVNFYQKYSELVYTTISQSDVADEESL
ncbi:hypothetical protein G6700_09330 [Polynucleobacter paneuropaeus]|jgi:hypothetical protein|nr:hypothetical protein G6700_09330 [Polynucleobacter paneuropaeus]